MTDNGLITVRPSINLIIEADADAARKIKMLLPYGNKLTDDNALALAAYSRLHGLDPFNGECYFLVREKFDDNGRLIKREELGVYPGIRGKRKLAKQQLQAVDPDGSYRIDYMVVGPDQVGLKPQPGEIAIVIQADLRDTQSTSSYIKNLLELQKAGVDNETIRAIMGKPPVWTGFGIVKQNELRYIKQSPIVLAKKRAESDATNQRFDLPFSDDAIADDIAPELVTEVNTIDVEVVEDKPQKTTAQLMDELGFDEPPNNNGHEPDPEQPAIPEPVMEAMQVTNSDGIRYGDIPNDVLSHMTIGINKGLAKPDLTNEKQSEYLNKLNAIKTILEYRNQGVAA